MNPITIHIKNMCCNSCIELVRSDLNLLGLVCVEVVLGHATFIASPKITLELINEQLKKHGFELILGKEERIVESVKIAILELIHYNDHPYNKIAYSDFISKKLKLSYDYLSRIFSKYTKITIEKYIILQRIERVKELIEYNELTFSEISDLLGYKTLAYLSNQFKKETQMTMSDYKENKTKNRRSINEI